MRCNSGQHNAHSAGNQTIRGRTKQVQFPKLRAIFRKMHSPVATKEPAAVAVAVQSAYLSAFPEGDRMFVPRIFSWAVDYFTGALDEYQPIDVKYHDFEHTLQATLCLARLLAGRHLAQTQPVLPRQLFELALLAALLHDTGYLKKKGDAEGTGAKYTVIHVHRSAVFAAELLAKKGYTTTEVKAVQNMILCTGINAPLDAIPFQNNLERIAGFALGSADLLGQMAAEDYVDKLPLLFAEFAEAARHNQDKKSFVSLFTSAADLRQKTPGFWEEYAHRKLERDFGGLYQFLNDPYPSGPNPYLARIEANMVRLRRELAEHPQAVS
jgi:hypothetical protein